MRKLREILRLRLKNELSMRQIRDSLKLSLGTIQKVVNQSKKLDLDWSAVEKLNDQQLASHFHTNDEIPDANERPLPCWEDVHKDLKRKGVTQQLLWEEYVQEYPGHSYSYPQYCVLYRAWSKKQKRSMRQTHKAGEKLFVDYAGQTVPIVSQATGEVYFAEIFVAVLGASNYTFCEATRSQKLPDWLGSHARAFEFIGGVPLLVVPDNLKSGVTRACRYDPDVNPSYQQLAAHYGTTIVPARPRKPKDKAKAEVGVQIIERWILAKLRHQTFFSLTELNICIRALLEEANNKPFKQLKGTRRQWYESLDKPALASLPKHAYEYTDIKRVKVNIDYHIHYDQHFYSVPDYLVGEKIEMHAKDKLIECFFHNKRVTSHARKYYPGTTTLPEHMPVRHEKHHKWTPAGLMNWAKAIGNEVLIWIQAVLKQKQHEEEAYRVCLGLLRLSKSYSEARLNNACAIANKHGLYRLKHINGILQSNQDQLLSSIDDSEYLPLLPQSHENIRGPGSFH